MNDLIQKVELGCTDLAVVNAARVSFNKWKDNLTDGDYKLIDYLAKHKHWTPFAHSIFKFTNLPINTSLFTDKFAMAGLVITKVYVNGNGSAIIDGSASCYALLQMDKHLRFSFKKAVAKYMPYSAEALWEGKVTSDYSHPIFPDDSVTSLRVTAPIFVARQWFKHIQGVVRNEVSRRYVNYTPEYFSPKVWRSKPEGSIKQGSSPKPVNLKSIENELHRYEADDIDLYDKLLKLNVAPEQARMVLAQSAMTMWVETGYPFYFENFVGLRDSSDAQEEIRNYAQWIKENALS